MRGAERDDWRLSDGVEKWKLRRFSRARLVRRYIGTWVPAYLDNDRKLSDAYGEWKPPEVVELSSC